MDNGEDEIDSYFKHNGVYENLSALTGIPIDILQMPIPPLNLGTSLKESDFIGDEKNESTRDNG